MDDLVMILLVTCLAEIGIESYRKTRKRKPLFLLSATLILLPLTTNLLENDPNFNGTLIFSMIISAIILAFFMGIPMFIAVKIKEGKL